MEEKRSVLFVCYVSYATTLVSRAKSPVESSWNPVRTWGVMYLCQF